MYSTAPDKRATLKSSFSSSKIQSVYSTAPANRATLGYRQDQEILLLLEIPDINLCVSFSKVLSLRDDIATRIFRAASGIPSKRYVTFEWDRHHTMKSLALWSGSVWDINLVASTLLLETSFNAICQRWEKQPLLWWQGEDHYIPICDAQPSKLQDEQCFQWTKQ